MTFKGAYSNAWNGEVRSLDSIKSAVLKIDN